MCEESKALTKLKLWMEVQLKHGNFTFTNMCEIIELTKSFVPVVPNKYIKPICFAKLDYIQVISNTLDMVIY